MPNNKYTGVYNDIAACIQKTGENELKEYCTILDHNKGDATCPFRGGLITITLTEEAGFFSTKKKETSETKYRCLKREALALTEKSYKLNDPED